MDETQVTEPSLVRGWRIFSSRPLALIAALIVAVIVSVITFLLLVFPVITGYYYAVRQSRRERFFIDLETVAGTTGDLFVGIRKYFLASYVIGILGLVVPLLMLVLPVVALGEGRELTLPSLIFGVLWVPAFFLLGSVVLYGYPALIVSGRATASLGYAVSAGRDTPVRAFLLGFLILFPVTGFLFHVLMVFSYPILVASALGTARQVELELPEGADPELAEFVRAQEVTPGRLAFGLGLAALMFGVIYGCAWLWGGVGLFVGLGISFLLVLAAHAKGII
jgi:hypothetical protein